MKEGFENLFCSILIYEFCNINGSSLFYELLYIFKERLSCDQWSDYGAEIVNNVDWGYFIDGEEKSNIY